MRLRLQKLFFALVSLPFLLCSCGNVTPSNQSYDGRIYDISAAQDGSLTAQSKKDGNYYSLTITGEGVAIDYSKKEGVPWNPIVKKINSVSITDGIKNIGDYFFNSLVL